jgi:hypothetical protein
MYGMGKELKEFAIRVLSLTCSATGVKEIRVFFKIFIPKKDKNWSMNS